MHDDVVADEPGRCPKCGMALEDEHGNLAPVEPETPVSWRAYLPLITVIGIIALATAALGAKDQFDGDYRVQSSLTVFMAGFFLTFAAFKLMDLKGFAEGYQTYDLLAKPVPVYGYVYPFLELGIGIAMLLSFHPDWLLWSEVGLMTFSGVGVVVKLAKHEPFTCSCLGTFLKVPLTKVTVVEDFGMAALGLALLFL